LVSFQQAVGVIVGATFGTASTPWLVAIFGFRVSVAAAALPMLGIGAFLWLIAKGRTRSLGGILAGFGVLFSGIEYLQTGMAGIFIEPISDPVRGSRDPRKQHPENADAHFVDDVRQRRAPHRPIITQAC
jgi:hypothetical protein